MTASRRIVITGIGSLTPLGKDVDQLFSALSAGPVGLRPIRTFDASALPTRIAAQIDGFDAKTYVVDRAQRKSLRMMARPIQLAVAAAQVALGHGLVDKGKLDPARFGVEFGSGLIASDLP